MSFLDNLMYEGDWFKTIRYYNDMLWLTYSISGMVKKKKNFNFLIELSFLIIFFHFFFITTPFIYLFIL